MTLDINGSDVSFAARAVKVTKIYGEGDAAVRALDSVTVGFPMGNFTAIMGPSGSGKSTLMHCVAGLDDVTSGQVFLGATEVTSLNDKDLTLLRRDQVGFVFQAFAGVSDNDARAAVDPIVKDYPTVSLKDQTQFKQDLAKQINKLL